PSAAKRTMKSSGWSTMCVVPSQCGVFSRKVDVTPRCQRQRLGRDRRPAHVATEPVKLLASIRLDADTRVQPEPRVLGYGLAVVVSALRRAAVQREDLPPGERSNGNTVRARMPNPIVERSALRGTGLGSLFHAAPPARTFVPHKSQPLARAAQQPMRVSTLSPHEVLDRQVAT